MFVNYLQAQSEADEWFEELPEEEKESWVSIEVQFRRKWLKQEAVRPKEVTTNEIEPRLAPTPSETATPDPHHETGTGNSAQNTSQATIMSRSVSTQTTPQTGPVTPSSSPAAATSRPTLPAQPSSRWSASSTTVTNSISPPTNNFTAPRKRRHTLSDYPTTSQLSLQTTVTHPVHHHFAAASPTSTVALPSTTTLKTSNQAMFSDQKMPVTSDTTYTTSKEVQRVFETQEMEAIDIHDDEQAGTPRHAVSSLEQAGYLPNLVRCSRRPTTPHTSLNIDSTLTNSAATLTTLSTTKDTLLSPPDAVSSLATPLSNSASSKPPTNVPPRPPSFKELTRAPKEPDKAKSDAASGGAAGASDLPSVHSLDARTCLANDTESSKGGSVRKFNGSIDIYRKTPTSDRLGITGLYPSLYFGVGATVIPRRIIMNDAPSSGKDPPYSLSSLFIYILLIFGSFFSSHISCLFHYIILTSFHHTPTHLNTHSCFFLLFLLCSSSCFWATRASPCLEGGTWSIGPLPSPPATSQPYHVICQVIVM